MAPCALALSIGFAPARAIGPLQRWRPSLPLEKRRPHPQPTGSRAGACPAGSKAAFTPQDVANTRYAAHPDRYRSVGRRHPTQLAPSEFISNPVVGCRHCRLSLRACSPIDRKAAVLMILIQARVSHEDLAGEDADPWCMQ